jgi:glutathione synthase/RimK-type ligase-like ATP-grasp enzyme
MSGPRPLGIWPTCHAAFSRLVDGRFRVPDPEQDWHEGRIQPENTEREAAFVSAVLQLCDREKIDTIFPSNDPWTYVFAKNKKLFEQHGILIPVPDYETVIRPLDKYCTVQDAEVVGFPAPRTFLPENETDLERIARELEPPWIIKPRFTTGGRGLTVVENLDQLRERTGEIRQRHSMPIIQEYIPGRGGQNFALVLDRDGHAVSVFTPRVVRSSGRVFRNQTAACVSAPPHPLSDKAVRLVAHMGWWGGATVQAKLDARDGSLKLMEVNPRLGTHLWYRTELGINEPLMCLKIAQGEPVEFFGDYPLDYTLLEPVEDVVAFFTDLLDLAIYRLRTSIFRKRGIDAASPPKTIRQTIAAYGEQYFTRTKRRFSPYIRYGLNDPLPALIWTSKILGRRSIMNMKGIGR